MLKGNGLVVYSYIPLVEQLSSVPNISLPASGGSQAPVTPAPGESNALFGSSQAPA